MKKKRYEILAVEDDRDTFIGLHVALTSSGYDVIRAEDGTMAVHLLATKKVDLVLLDLGLPAGDGFFVLKCIQNNGLSLPVIVVSARDSFIHKRKALAAGATEYFEKPVNLHELLDCIDDVLSKCHAPALED